MISGSKRFFANQCLIVAAVLYIGSTFFLHSHFIFGYLKAFAEAAIVGGIADWFAVTALFKHPLGLKIPHTAIIPNSKSKIGKNISHFIRENFLSEKYVKENLRKIDIHAKAVLLLRSNQSALVKKANETVFNHIDKFEYKDIERFVQPFVKSKLDSLDVNFIMIKLFELMDNKNYHHAAFTMLLVQFNKWLSNPINEHMINEEIKNLIKKDEDGKNTFTGIMKSFFIGEPKLHKYLTDFISHMKSDPEQKVIKRVDNFFEDIIQKLKTDETVRQHIVDIKNGIIDNLSINEHVEVLFNETKKWILNDFHSSESFITYKISEMIDKTITEIEESKVIKRWVKQQVEGKVPAFIADNATLIDNYFIEYLENLDTEQVSKLIENKVGEDLQFIRINGTLIGGFVGLVLYTMTELITYISQSI